MRSLKDIKTSKKVLKPSDIMKAKYDDDRNKMPVVFSFGYFCWKSIRSGDFNNYYLSKENARDQAEKFISTLKDISKLQVGQLDSKEMKRSLRFKPIRNGNGKEVERIIEVLREYAVSEGTIEEFEKSFHEFSVNDGMRVICVQEDNIIHLLFLDNNHLICSDSAKFKKAKQSFGVPTIFDCRYMDDSISEGTTKEQVFDLMLKGEFRTIEDVLNFYNELKEVRIA
ncbi:hypothetical protein IKF63_01570 [Candidatus Saccharibacteria bacterium]|nr:hypothetical protein [Candidatus Saccharibacteria bacterium]